MSTVPSPPRLTGNGPADLAAMQEWAFGLYRALVLANPDRRRLDAVAAVPPLPPGASLGDVITTVNAIIAAAGRAS
jgi:hypothetical protein